MRSYGVMCEELQTFLIYSESYDQCPQYTVSHAGYYNNN